MTIASEITRINNNIVNAYTAAEAKGATIPVSQNSANLTTTIGSITELKGETRSVTLTSSAGNTFTPTSDKNGITSITVTPNNETRTVTPTTSSQSLIVNSGYSGNGTITVNAVTSSIDSNISAGNIKSGVSILGVTGSYEGEDSDYNFSYRLLIDGTIQPSVSAIAYEGYLNDTSIEGLNWCITNIDARAERMFLHQRFLPGASEQSPLCTAG